MQAVNSMEHYRTDPGSKREEMGKAITAYRDETLEIESRMSNRGTPLLLSPSYLTKNQGLAENCK